jgi:hypothetical protein
VARRKKAVKKTARKAKRRATSVPRRAVRPKKTGRPGRAAPRKSAQKPAAGRKGAARKSGTVRAPAGSRKAAASRVAAGGASAFAPAGEVYGEESWKEEELSAVELDSDVPELEVLEAQLEDPEIAEESEDPEW